MALTVYILNIYLAWRALAVLW